MLSAEASQNATHQDLVALQESLSRLRDALGDSAISTFEARNFHQLIASVSKNLVLGFLVAALRRMSEHSTIEYDSGHWKANLRHSEKVLSAIEQRDADTARIISTQNHDATIRSWEKNHPDILNQPIAWVTADTN